MLPSCTFKVKHLTACAPITFWSINDLIPINEENLFILVANCDVRMMGSDNWRGIINNYADLLGYQLGILTNTLYSLPCWEYKAREVGIVGCSILLNITDTTSTSEEYM